jgi:SpoVK/Ycf46/Vps4 family AAA+-type ATPase
MFIDELDAIGFSRRKIAGGRGRSLVDQLLQELDAIGSENEGILVLAATNVPWDVDDALKRPGRFDRSVFVPPPDLDAREAILRVLLRDRPADGLDVKAVAEKTQLFSGADLAALVERATDRVIDAAVAEGVERPLSKRDFARALESSVPSTLEWIATARRYVEFANETGRYNDVRDFLNKSEARSQRLKRLG